MYPFDMTQHIDFYTAEIATESAADHGNRDLSIDAVVIL
jgi:hypothetical protein